MAGLDPNYIVGINLGEVFVDNTTGLPLSGGKLYFYEDSARSIPKTVFQLTGSPPDYTYSPLPNPIILSAVGKIVNNSGTNVPVYYKPFDSEGNIQNYYVYSESSDGTFQQEWQAWPNVTPASSPSGNTAIGSIQNEISNSQFVDVLFPTDTGLEISWTGALSETTYQIAPDWNLIIEASGTGNVTINRNAIAGSLNVITNPPFTLEFVASSVNITTLKLVQRLYNNPDIWANQYVSANMVVESLDGISRTFSIVYAPSISVSSTTLLTGASGASDPLQLFGSVLIPSGTNSEDGDVGYVDIEILLPHAGNYSITSIQVTSSDEEPDDAEAIKYQELSANRQRDFSFHTYRPQIVQLAVPSILQGWDFRVNPAQWGASQAIWTGASKYIWDQLIIFQSGNNAISVERASQDALQVNVELTSQFALIQYMEGTQLAEMLQSNFSTLISALTDISGGVSGTVSFWITDDASLPDAGANLSLVSTLDSDGKPASFNGNWTEVARSTGWGAKFTIPEQEEYQNIPLEGWSPVSFSTIAASTYAAIVVGFSQTDPGAVTFKEISVTPTLIASPVAPLSYNLTLSQLQRYYEKSYASSVNPGAVTLSNAIVAYGTNSYSESSATVNVRIQPIFIPWKAKKWAVPNVTAYSPYSGDPDKIGSFILQGDGVLVHTEDVNFLSFLGDASVISTDNISIAAGVAATPYSFSGSVLDTPYAVFFNMHYTADARLGIV